MRPIPERCPFEASGNKSLVFEGTVLNKLVCFLQTSYINGSLVEKEIIRCKVKGEVQNTKTKRDRTFVDRGTVSYTSYEKDIRLRVS